MSYFRRALRWVAPFALVGALGLAACGDNDDTEAVRVAAPSAAGVGSDQHLANKAEELARASASAGSDQHLNNKAAELTREQRAYQAASARLTAQAEQYKSAVEAGNRAAQMGQAERYVDQQQRAASSSSNRAAQMAQAESYVQQQQDRAEGANGYGGEFVPGSRHMPTR
jgi:hypothetical protein